MRRFLLTVSFKLFVLSVFSQERIAVFPFEVLDNAITVNESTQLYRNFSNQFTNISVGRFSVVPRQDIEKLINTEAKFQLSDFSAKEKTAEMERVLNGTHILSGVVGKVGSRINISVSLYTYPDLIQLPGGADLRVANKDELFDKIPELVQSMQNNIGNITARQPAISQPLPQSSLQPLPQSSPQPLQNNIVPAGLEYNLVDGKSVTITRYTGKDNILNIPENIQGLPVTAIKTSAFFHCTSLTSVNIPSSLTSIGYGNPFDGCKNLTSITVDNLNNNYASVDGVLFDKNIKTIISYPRGKKGAYSIPSSVTSIGYSAFYSCESLTSVNIPSSVTSIGDSAFSHCTSLTSVDIPSLVTSIGFMAFSSCTSLTSVNIPSSVTSIGRSSFSHCTSLTSINIPSSVTSIGDMAFDGCKNLTRVTLSRHTKVGSFAFPIKARKTYSD